MPISKVNENSEAVISTNDFLEGARMRASEEFGSFSVRALKVLTGRKPFPNWKEQFEKKLTHGGQPKEILDALPAMYDQMIKEIQAKQLEEKAEQQLLEELSEAYSTAFRIVAGEAEKSESKRADQSIRKRRQIVGKDGTTILTKNKEGSFTELPNGSMVSSQGVAKDKSPIYGIEFINASKDDMPFFAEKLLQEYGEGQGVKIDAGSMLEHPFGTIWGKPKYLELQRQLLYRGMTPIPCTLDISEQKKIDRLVNDKEFIKFREKQKSLGVQLTQSEIKDHIARMEKTVEKWANPVAGGVGQLKKENDANKENVGVNDKSATLNVGPAGKNAATLTVKKSNGPRGIV